MKHPRLKTLSIRLLIFLITCLSSLWLFQVEPRDIVPVLAPVVTTSQTEWPELIFPELDDRDLFYKGYVVKKSEPKTSSIPVSYAVVKRDGEAIAKFDANHFGVRNSTDFGLFDLLGDRSQQLIVSLTAPRTGRHWVVSLYPKFYVHFDSRDYDVSREELGVIDLDNDGVYEISLPIVSYYRMEGLRSVSETPLPEIVFKYDAELKRYLPANHLFVDYVLRDLNAESEEETYKHRRFDILLDYVYAGKEKEGWASFDKHYPSEDKEIMRSRIKAILKDDPVYKFIYKQPAK